MPAKSPETAKAAAAKLVELGKQIRARRKSLRVSAIAFAESAGMSRVTLHRIEKGEPSVTMGAYLNALAALGMDITIDDRPALIENADDLERPGWLPARIRLTDYPQLKQLAWQVQGTNELKPAEAFGIYERNLRHIDFPALEARERNLIDALRLAFEGERRDV